MKSKSLSVAAILLSLVVFSPASAQTFSSGSNGTDGALTIAPNQGTITFDPRNFVPALDQDNDGIYHFTTITVGMGTTVKLSAAILGEGKPVIWLASGAVQIDGILDLNGEEGHSDTQMRIPAVAGAGGYSGGKGNDTVLFLEASPGNGPGGAPLPVPGQNPVTSGLGAGHLSIGGSSTSPGGIAYGNPFLLPLTGGSGGSGSLNQSGRGSGGGAGGGAILIASSVSITLQGSITANGGEGGRVGFSPLGGAGSGGAVRLIAPSVVGSGSISAVGGGSVQSNSNSASPGRIRLEAFNDNTGLTLDPRTDDVAAPGPVFAPNTAPTIRVTSIHSQAVPTNPTGNADVPDVTINASNDVTIEISAVNIPPGTTVEVTIKPETGASTVVTGTLNGTLANSTAIITARIESGVSRVLVRADWNP